MLLSVGKVQSAKWVCCYTCLCSCTIQQLFEVTQPAALLRFSANAQMMFETLGMAYIRRHRCCLYMYTSTSIVLHMQRNIDRFIAK